MEVISYGNKEEYPSRGYSTHHLELPEVPKKGCAGDSNLCG
jgi:hypothetical protein